MPTNDPAVQSNYIAEAVIWLRDNLSELFVTASQIFLFKDRSVSQAKSQAKNLN